MAGASRRPATSPSPSAAGEPSSASEPTDRQRAADALDGMPDDATGPLMLAIGRQQLQGLLRRSGKLVAVTTADPDARTAGLRSCRIENVALERSIALPAGGSLHRFQRIVIDGDLPTRAYPAQVCFDGRPVATLHQIGQSWVAISGAPADSFIGSRVAIAYGPTGLDAGFAEPLQIPNEDNP